MMVANRKHSLLPLTMLRTVPGEGPGVSFSPLPLAGEGQGVREGRRQDTELFAYVGSACRRAGRPVLGELTLRLVPVARP